MVSVFVPKEVRPGERRVAATPASIKKFIQRGWKVMVEQGAGSSAYFDDADYIAAGAEIVSRPQDGFLTADVVLMVNVPQPEQIGFLQEGSSIVSFLYPSSHPQILEALSARRVSAFAMDQIPRITRAQKHDALSSQSNLAGYKAVLLAATAAPKLFPLMMTAAGTLKPSRVVILGAGVAGLQAIATAKRLGAIVEVSDVRPAVKEQVQSLGATFIEVPTDPSMQDAGGYAKEATPEFLKKQGEITRQYISRADVVITTALVPGKRAPVLIEEEVVKSMRPGSVIVDMAAEQGGNCTLTVPDETVVRHGVTIVGACNLASTVPAHASEAYATNVLNVLLDQITGETGSAAASEFKWNLEDEIVKTALVLRRGERPAAS